MATARAERLINLVLCLLSTRHFLSAERIRATVPGYAAAATDEAFYRMFERDKTELRDLGVPLESGSTQGGDVIDGYRIARRDYELADIDLAPDEAAAVALAARLWDSPELIGAAQGALLKLRAAGVEVEDQSSSVEPRIHTGEPTFPALLTAVREGAIVAFDYRRPQPLEVRERVVEPWGVVAWRGRWYLVGHDRYRGDTRCFRLSRIVGGVRVIGKAGEVRRPSDANLLQFVAGSQSSQREQPSPSVARLWIAKGRANGLRRRARLRGEQTLHDRPGDIMEFTIRFPDSAVSWIAGFGPDVVVLHPQSLADSVRERLIGALGIAKRVNQ